MGLSEDVAKMAAKMAATWPIALVICHPNFTYALL